MQFSSGDLRADRRYDYALGLLKEGDKHAAKDLILEALEIAPDWLPALALLAECGEGQEKINALNQLISFDKDDLFGGRLTLASLENRQEQISDAYITALFDDYAPRFEKALVHDLQYKVPELLFDALRDYTFNRVLDVGCGTGLMGEKLRACSQVLEGIDLSSKMVKIAEHKNCYDALFIGEMVSFLKEAKPYDLIIAADVLVYVADLKPFIDISFETLNENGILVFTVQTHAGQGVVIGGDKRAAHSLSYLQQQLFIFSRVEMTPITPRYDAGKPINGLMVLAYK